MKQKVTHVAIVGGGVSGICAATKLAKKFLEHNPRGTDQKLEIVIIDPNPKLGGPLYNTGSINALLAQPFDEIDLPAIHKRRASIHNPDQITYSDYGKYLRQHLKEMCQYLDENKASVQIHGERSEGDIKIPYLRAEVLDAHVKGDHAELELSTGKTLKADVVVLATGNPLPENLRDSKGTPLSNYPGYYRSYQEGLAPDKLNETDNIALIGMGAGAHTFAASAIRNGYKGNILLASRRGKSPECEPPPDKRPSRSYTFRYFTLEALNAMKAQNGNVTADQFWELFLKETHHAAPLGFKRREVADACFDYFNDMNRMMSVEERAKFAEKYGADWNFMTNRIPEIHRKILSNLCVEGRTNYREKIASIDHLEGGGFSITFDDGKVPPQITVPKIVNCTGPSVQLADMSPLLRKMQEHGLVTQHPLAGINVDEKLHVKDYNGTSSKTLYALGPPTQGEFFESVSIPAIKLCADTLVESIMYDHNLGRFSGEGMSGSIAGNRGTGRTGSKGKGHEK